MERTVSLSKRWKNWTTIEDEKRCWECEKYHGKIYAITEKPKPRRQCIFGADAGL